MSTKARFQLTKLVVFFSRATEEIVFTDVTYFFGQMGSGKTSIARLIDYCFGGGISLTPALLSEFVSARLYLKINENLVEIERPRDSDTVIVAWKNRDNDDFAVNIPISNGSGPVLVGTNVEVLSDVLYYLADLDPPKVRRSKIKENSDLQRLSFRELFWYCYIDQDNIDSSFFNLDEDANPFKRLKSKDVLRFLLGFHQEQVAELESRLHELQIQKAQYHEAAKSLKEALKEAFVGSVEEIDTTIASLKADIVKNEDLLDELKSGRIDLPHSVEFYRNEARYLGDEIEALNAAVHDTRKTIDQDRRHRNEILTLGVKVQRMAGARAVLGGVNFVSCPRCTQSLPPRSLNHCPVCDQMEPADGQDNLDPDVLKRDAKARVEELTDLIDLQEEQMRLMEHRRDELQALKFKVDANISTYTKDYDSAYLSNALRLEKENSQIDEKISQLQKLRLISLKVVDFETREFGVEAEQIEVRSDLKEARALAESDLSNLDLLKDLFKDCLIRSKFPGVDDSSIVHIAPKDFLPIVENPKIGDIAVTSFSNVSSGGKKTLYKACFAIAIHRLANEIGAFLPSLLIIDSPMKNISERENIDQFQNFHNLIYELATSEFRDTQIILIDKEYFNPAENLVLNMSIRHMTLDKPVYPPLIPYYQE